MPAKPINDSSFASAVSNGTVIVDFWASWCGPCKRMLPVMDQVGDARPGQVFKLNVDDSPQTASRFGVHAIPTVIIFQNGQEVERHSGLHAKDEVIAMLDAHGGAPAPAGTDSIISSISNTFDSIFPSSSSGQPSQADVTQAAADVQLAAAGHPAASPEAAQFVQDHADSNGWTSADTAAVAGSAAGALGLGLTFLLAKSSAPKPRKVVTAASMKRPVAFQPAPIQNSGASNLWKIGIALAVVAGVGALFLTRKK